MICDELSRKSHEVFNFWKNPKGWAPDSVTELLVAARLDWLSGLTDALEIWVNRVPCMTDGELLLARANLGALVEGWLMLFYCVYYEDYRTAPLTKKNGEMVPPNSLKMEQVKQFSRGILWNPGSEWDKWVERVQRTRNAIHAFNDRDIGTPQEFMDDVCRFSDFIDVINSRLPYPW